MWIPLPGAIERDKENASPSLTRIRSRTCVRAYCSVCRTTSTAQQLHWPAATPIHRPRVAPSAPRSARRAGPPRACSVHSHSFRADVLPTSPPSTRFPQISTFCARLAAAPSVHCAATQGLALPGIVPQSPTFYCSNCNTGGMGCPVSTVS